MLPSEQEDVRQCLRYLHRHLKSQRAAEWTKADEDFYLMGLNGCTLAHLKQTFRAGISKWRWMPRPVDILELYREVVGTRPTYVPLSDSPSGCEVCDGTGWEPIPGNKVTPCHCPKGQARRAKRPVRG